jgi:hypothetical protein
VAAAERNFRPVSAALQLALHIFSKHLGIFPKGIKLSPQFRGRLHGLRCGRDCVPTGRRRICGDRDSTGAAPRSAATGRDGKTRGHQSLKVSWFSGSGPCGPPTIRQRPRADGLARVAQEVGSCLICGHEEVSSECNQSLMGCNSVTPSPSDVTLPRGPGSSRSGPHLIGLATTLEPPFRNQRSQCPIHTRLGEPGLSHYHLPGYVHRHGRAGYDLLGVNPLDKAQNPCGHPRSPARRALALPPAK